MSRLLATYRIQVHAGFSLPVVTALVDYLSVLGVSHVYLSPILKSRKGSTHGYDVVDPDRLDPELGAEDDLRELAKRLHERGMGVLLDIVPNHMAGGNENPRWQHMLTFGHRSPYARWFDIEWSTPHPELRGKVMLPVLGQTRSRILARGELTLRREVGRVRLCYHEHRFPISPRSAADLLSYRTNELAERLGANHQDVQAYHAIVSNLNKAHDNPFSERLAEVEDRLASLCRESEAVCSHVDRILAAFAEGDDGRKRLERLLERQSYRLVYWRRAAREINYRRFFDINELVGLRMEDPQVFDEYHRRIFNWIREGCIDALRIDHIDGLLDPQVYLERLSQTADGRRSGEHVPVYVEKILSGDEKLREGWPVAGTTGYEFLNRLEAVFIDPAGYAALERTYFEFLGRRTAFSDVAYNAKRQMLSGPLSSYVRALVRILESLSPAEQPGQGLERGRLGAAIMTWIAALDVYRTYMSARTPSPDESDCAVIERAFAKARRRAPDLSPQLDLLRRTILGNAPETTDERTAAARLRFIQRLQQTSGPAAAKGVEDTALYVFVPLASRNEVGAEPDEPIGGSVGRLHEANRHRAACWPESLLCTSTHDTKRSADVRARLDVLSERADEWSACVRRWRRQNARFRRIISGKRAPDANTEYLLYQTLVGMWPVRSAPPGSAQSPDPGGGTRFAPAALEPIRERLRQYMLKATREAKVRTSWLRPNAEYEAAVNDFIGAILDEEGSASFLSDLDSFVRRLIRPGLWNALARTLVHLTAPGVPDLLQGDELWNFSLVDPDNRRPVDFDRRTRVLEELVVRWNGDQGQRRDWVQELVAQPEDGRIKLHVIARALAARRRFPEVYTSGSYEPLEATGPRAQHVIGFQRRAGTTTTITVVPRLIRALTGDLDHPPTGERTWAATTLRLPTTLGKQNFQCAITGQQLTPTPTPDLPLPKILQTAPVALLVTEAGR